MKTLYNLSASTVVDLRKTREARRVMAFAENLVDEFYLSLPGEVARFPPDSQVLLIGSWEDLMTGDENDLEYYCGETGRSGRELLNFGFAESVTAEQAAAALTFSEDEMRVALMAVLVNLRRIDIDGSTREAERMLDASVALVGGLIHFALTAAGAVPRAQK
ncbi:hypothetical protein C8J31_11435 [Rhizobium sp. PP-CC-2G-626]|nr:hypothetical protein C8J31_11435 [Rhizobium sp. PP-CC-2G-626]